MNVLHINSYYNGSVFYRHLFAAQEALGEHVRVFVPMAKGDKGARTDYGPWSDVSPNHGKYDRLIFQLKHAKVLRDARTRYGGGGYDVIHAHSLFSNGYIAMKLSEQLGIPYVVAVRGTDVNTFFPRMPHLRGLGRRVLRGAARVIFLSDGYRENGLKPYLSKAELDAVLAKSLVIPNGIDAWWHEHEGARHTLHQDALRLLTVGRANKGKNILTALKAAEQLAAQGMDVRFDVVIGVVDDEAILKRIEQTPFVTLHQKLSREQLLPLYRAADIYVMPSLSETFGLVYAEAMSQGLPVIYTRGQGFDGQFPEGEVGFAVDPMDASGIAGAIDRIRADYDRISENCVRLSRRFDWAEFARQYDEIYREVTHKR